MEVPGGSQALGRTELVDVSHDGRVGVVPRPSLLAAIIAKAAAVQLPGDSARHVRDLALLLCLVQDPFTMSEELTAKDRKRLKLASALLGESHAAWKLAPTARRRDGQDTLRLLTTR